MKTFIIVTLWLIASCFGTFGAEGITTLTVKGPGSSNEVQITSSQTVRIKTYYDSYFATIGSGLGKSRIDIQKDGITFNLNKGINFYPSSSTYIGDVMIQGPALIRLSMLSDSPASENALLTLDVQPAAFLPGKTVTVGAFSGNVQVTMELSTDLVNWTPATNGLVYTNSPDARFFRIKMVTNATP